jgi:hypothetical protein
MNLWQKSIFELSLDFQSNWKNVKYNNIKIDIVMISVKKMLINIITGIDIWKLYNGTVNFSSVRSIQEKNYNVIMITR